MDRALAELDNNIIKTRLEMKSCTNQYRYRDLKKYYDKLIKEKKTYCGFKGIAYERV